MVIIIMLEIFGALAQHDDNCVWSRERQEGRGYALNGLLLGREYVRGKLF